MRFNLQAGKGTAMSAEEDQENMLLIGAALDDSVQWVKLPPQLGGERVSVARAFMDKCFKCSQEHPALELAYKHKGRDLIVIECGNQFLFFTKEKT